MKWIKNLIPLAVCAAGACDDPPANPKVASSSQGVVVSQAPLAAQIGADILSAGGNAVDAAVATAFALAVVEPTNSGLGGRTQIVIRSPGGEISAIDATTQVPMSYPVDSVPPANAGSGYGMVGIPGTVAGLTRALAEHGTMALPEVMAPAIALAADGFALNEAQANSIAGVAEHLMKYDGSRSYFLKPDGSAYATGETFVQADLANTLSLVANGGAEAFYRGPIAAHIVDDMVANGGFIRLEDLATYEARDALIVRGQYQGYELVGTYLPAAGANTIEMLQILEHFDLEEKAGTSEFAALVGQALAMGFKDRLSDLANMGPAETFPLPENAAAMISPERAAQRAAEVRPFQIASSAQRVTTVMAGTFPPGHTSHVSVVDAEGGAVSMTQSLGPTMGSRVAAPGLGFMYAATMGYLSGEAASAGISALGPGHRASSRQSPMMVLRDGQLEVVLGGSGSRRIVSALVQVVSHLVDGDSDIESAVAAPRVHVEPSEPGVLHMQVLDDRSWSVETRADLRAFGFDVRDQHTQSFGNVSAIQWEASSQQWVGVAEPGGPGAAVAATER
jgi:gamma-glutamyltranspeptidase/glutathione hydrolase